MDDKHFELGVVERIASAQKEETNEGSTSKDDAEMAYYGKEQQLKVITIHSSINDCH
jgi:hypothetical protein